MCLIKHDVTKTYGDGDTAPRVLILAIDGVHRSVSNPGALSPKEIAPGTHWVGGCVGPRAGLDAVKKR
jgi:hypothetical protein